MIRYSVTLKEVIDYKKYIPPKELKYTDDGLSYLSSRITGRNIQGPTVSIPSPFAQASRPLAAFEILFVKDAPAFTCV